MPVSAQKPGKCLQRSQRLAWRSQYAEVQVEAVKVVTAVLLDRFHVMHRDDRITADQRPVTMNEIARFFSAEKIDRVPLVQSADQREVVPQSSSHHGIPARIDDEDTKARRPGRLLLARAGTGRQLDDGAVASRRRGLRNRSRRGQFV